MIAHRGSTVIIQLGLFAVVLAALPFKLFELDRYFLPKEAVLHAVALLVGIAWLGRGRRMRVDLADMLLAGFLGVSVVSALFATNHWLAQRALGISVSSAVLFWSARAIGEDGGHRPILAAAAWATVLASLIALLQAYGITSDYFSLNRAPGGTFGNRNSVAHIAAIGLPSLVYVAITSPDGRRGWLSTGGLMIVSAALVLTRSRAAWLAAAVSGVAVLLPLVALRRQWTGVPVGARLARLTLAAAVAGGLAIVLPNALRWRSDSPYLESAMSVADYSSGSGRGRVAQYRNSLGIVREDPLLGAGPGNWPVKYVRHAPAGDRSLTDDGMTANPWPSSDWVAHLSERGPLATVALLGVFAFLFVAAFRGGSALDADQALARVALAGTIAAAMVVSAFDAALLLAAPALFVWSIAGAGSGVGRRGRELFLSGTAWTAVVALTVLLLAASLFRSAAQVVSVLRVGHGGTRAGWLAAARWDPGSYRINLRVAELHLNRGRCPAARVAARRAQSLFPGARAPRRIIRSCG
jgi:hypothetical protein